ncbi:MAG: circadian clock KaiB family protein [Anaerolineae bacterium]
MMRDNELLHPQHSSSKYVFTLYVAGHSARSLWMISFVRGLFEARFHGDYDLRVVDVYQYPHAADDANVMAIPTLIKHQPVPACKQVGYSIDLDYFTASLS